MRGLEPAGGGFILSTRLKAETVEMALYWPEILHGLVHRLTHLGFARFFVLPR